MSSQYYRITEDENTQKSLILQLLFEIFIVMASKCTFQGFSYYNKVFCTVSFF